MQVQIYFTPLFDRKYKKYLKKYHSLSNDLRQLISEAEIIEILKTENLL